MSPEFSDKTKKKLEEIISRYSRKEAAILPVLHLTQKEFGCISVEEEKLVAELLDIKPIQVREVATFYTMLNQMPVGKYYIQVCSNLSCSLLGAESLIDYLTEKIGIKPGETTQDNKFTLSTVECLGACEMAPCMMINFDYHGNLDKKKIDKILEGLK
ncbi:MAG: NADH-quinone oxidoreductase subunit NuoE [Candidatus Aminicenantes bacterium]|nr:NADH-quinone oxidoreductase subunit NuoE [Candidatus Aminicenantes bacterium]